MRKRGAITMLVFAAMMLSASALVQGEEKSDMSYPLTSEELEEAIDEAELSWKVAEETPPQEGVVQFTITDEMDNNANGIVMAAEGEARYLMLLLAESDIPGKELEFTEEYLQKAVELASACYGGLEDVDIFADYLEDKDAEKEYWEKSYDDISCLIQEKEGLKEGMASCTLYLYNSEQYEPAIKSAEEEAE